MKKRTRNRTRLDPVMAAVDTPVFLLSDRRKVLFFNRGCETLTGWSAEEVVGRICDYASEPDPENIESLACSLCPPPRVFADEPASVRVYIVRRDATTTQQTVNFFPLSEEGRVVNVLGIITSAHAPLAVPAKNAVHTLHAELSWLRQRLRQRYAIVSIVCRSEPMLRVLEQIRLAGSGNASVHLEGEVGTGKEHVARAIHGDGETVEGAFVPLDCRRMRAIDLKLTLRRVLSGDRDADDDAKIPFSVFRPRTLYLAHVESLPRDLQGLVVDALQPDRNGQRPPLRLITSSTESLQSACENDIIRTDFYYLATSIVIKLPPLRRRPEDLELLAQSILEERNRVAEKQVAGFADEVWVKFREYNWPGNLDELEAVVNEARDACSGELIRANHLPFRFRAGYDAQAVGPSRMPPIEPLEVMLSRAETEHIQRALEAAGHNKSKAARLLGMTRPRLYRRMQTLGIADLETEKEA